MRLLIFPLTFTYEDKDIDEAGARLQEEGRKDTYQLQRLLTM